MKHRTEAEIRERIREMVVEAINTVPRDPEETWYRAFIDTLTDNIHVLVMDEITYRRL